MEFHQSGSDSKKLLEAEMLVGQAEHWDAIVQQYVRYLQTYASTLVMHVILC